MFCYIRFEGCQNSPAFQSRVCEDHKRTARSYVDEGTSVDHPNSETPENDTVILNEEYLAIQKIISSKSTRQGRLY